MTSVSLLVMNGFIAAVSISYVNPVIPAGTV